MAGDPKTPFATEAAIILAVLLHLMLRLLARFQFLAQFAIVSPSVALHSGVFALLGTGRYFILTLRYPQPVLKPLGWVVRKLVQIATASVVGLRLRLALHSVCGLRNQVPATIPIQRVADP